MKGFPCILFDVQYLIKNPFCLIRYNEKLYTPLITYLHTLFVIKRTVCPVSNLPKMFLKPLNCPLQYLLYPITAVPITFPQLLIHYSPYFGQGHMQPIIAPFVIVRIIRPLLLTPIYLI